jgi:hypothetical protein
LPIFSSAQRGVPPDGFREASDLEAHTGEHSGGAKLADCFANNLTHE